MPPLALFLGTDVEISKNIFGKKWQKWPFLTQNTSKFSKKLDRKIFLKPFFRRKSAEFAESCNHNIGPRSAANVWIVNIEGSNPRVNNGRKIEATEAT
jgi:hypothetical protein